jgi:hypothetical protein
LELSKASGNEGQRPSLSKILRSGRVSVFEVFVTEAEI